MTPNVLLIDDEPRNTALLRAQLARFDFEIHEALNGRVGLELALQLVPDLVLLDLEMPVMDGIEMLKRLRAREKARTPVIVVTAHSDREQRLQALEAGADEFLEKPVDRALLQVRIRTLLSLKASRDELIQRHAALLTTQREQRELMQFIIHELQAPLSVVQSGVLFADENQVQDPRESMNALRDAAVSIERVNDVVIDMLSICKLEEGQLALERRVINLRGAIESLAKAYERKARLRSIELETRAGDVMISADGTMFRRVLENILDNALRHTPTEGRVAIEVRRATPGHVRIAISNSGPPIPEDECQDIFQKFVQGRSSNSKPGALGIGLYFCKRALEAHGGTIQVEQSETWPTTFVIDLPGY